MCVPSREIGRFKRIAKIVRREKKVGNVWHRSMPRQSDAPIEAPPPQPTQLLPSPDQPKLPLRAPDSPTAAITVEPAAPQPPEPPQPAPEPPSRRWTFWGWWRS
jgi:hypothetical protein